MVEVTAPWCPTCRAQKPILSELLATPAAGLALSFTAIGLFVATIGFRPGSDGGVIRIAGAVVMVAVAALLLLPALQARLVLVLAPIGNRLDRCFSGLGGGSAGSFGVGLLLGAVWSPCVGPTLGAASLLAARGEDLGSVALTMTAFGVGAAIPLLSLGHLGRASLLARRDRLLATGKFGKQALGVMLGLVGLFILTGVDRTLETWSVEVSPPWLTNLAVGI